MFLDVIQLASYHTDDYDVTEGEQVDRYVREIARLKGIKKNR